ncbi:MAG: isochorismatase family protein [Burkholderiales bacterium]|jgi:isochorismate hydrolase|nr:isochorismatase family protein [Burkholderiales bacterium]
MHYSIDINQINKYNTHSAVINPKHTALLVIEMQKVFQTDLGIISDRQIKNIQNIIEASERSGIKIIYVRHNDSSEISKPMVDWWGGDKIEYGSDSWKMIDGFDITGKTVIDKNQYSAFYKTNLDEILKQNQIEDIIITGVMTNCCCETAARDAFMRGYRVFFINDATATVNEDLHLSTLKNLSFGFAYIQNTQDLVNNIKYE